MTTTCIPKSILYFGLGLLSLILTHSCRNTECVNENTIGLLRNSPDSYNGYTLYTANKNTYLIDNCGRVINRWTSEFDPGHAVYLLEDGSLLRANKYPNEHFENGGLGGRIEKKNWNDSLIWEFNYSDSLVSQHHDIVPMPNGNILILALTKKYKEEALASGRRPDSLTNNELYNEQIIEIQPTADGARVVWEWNLWDHLVQDLDPAKKNFGEVAGNPQLLDINYMGLSGGGANWIHFNSMHYNAQLDQIVLGSRQMHEIYIIDHSTTTSEAASHSGGRSGKGGDFLYRWGNPAAYKRGTRLDQKLFGPHYPYWIPQEYPDGGKIMIFNNGVGRDPHYSSVEIIAPPLNGNGKYELSDTGIFGPEDIHYSYESRNEPNKFFALFLSNSQRLPNGNTLINEGTNGRFFEVTMDGEVVWEYINPDTPKGILEQGQPAPTGNNVFRIWRYPVDYEAFKGKNLRPGRAIESNAGEPCCNISR